jgi:hypothetical protein
MKTWLIAQQFRVPYEAHRDAWRTLKETHGFIRDFQGERTARTLVEIFDHVGLKASVNEHGDIISLKAEAIEEYLLDTFLRDVAFFVAPGSRLAFFNQASLRTLYVFEQGKVFKDEKAIVYHAHEDSQFDEEI